MLVVEQPGEVLRGAQQDLLLLLARQGDVAHLSACIGRVLTDAGLWGDRRLRTGSAIQQEFTA